MPDAETQISAFLMIRDGDLIISDPCYLPTEKERDSASGFDKDLFNKLVHRVHIPPGHYPLYEVVLAGKLLGVILINRLRMPRDIKYEMFRAMVGECEDVGSVGVDSGMLSMTAEEALSSWDSNDWKSACDNHKDNVIVPIGRVFGLRVIQSAQFPMSDSACFTSYGDGVFPVLMAKDDAGNFKHLFIPTSILVSEEA